MSRPGDHRMGRFRRIQSENACGFAAVTNGDVNDLPAFGFCEGGWVYRWHNADALAQVKEPIALVDSSDETIRFASYYLLDGEIMDACLGAASITAHFVALLPP